MRLRHFVSIFIIGAVLVLQGCNRTKRSSNHLIEGKTWLVTTLTVDDVSLLFVPTWEMNACDIYDEACYATWRLSDLKQASS